MKLPYGESVNYWKTSRTSPDTWLERARKEITNIGGQVLTEAFGSEPTTGRAAFMLTFVIKEDHYKVVWPVLPTKNKGEEKAARIQAATFLYHDIKAKCLSAAILGARTSFFSYLMLLNGKTAADIADDEIMHALPELLRPAAPALDAGIVEGEYNS
jgi:hypothetical protein